MSNSPDPQRLFGLWQEAGALERSQQAPEEQAAERKASDPQGIPTQKDFG